MFVNENGRARNDDSESRFQRLHSQGILNATPYLHAGSRCCAACACGHLCTSFANWRREEACAKDNTVYGVMIAYGTRQVNSAQRRSSGHAAHSRKRQSAQPDG